MVSTEGVARALSRLIPGDVVFFAKTRADEFALTFDDGPSPETTPGLLGVLAKHRAQATFFLIGERVRAHPELARAIVAGGHEIANHLMRDERSALRPADEFRRDLAEVTALLEEFGPVRWFRPGAGLFTPPMLRAAAGQNLRAVLGTRVAGHYDDRTAGRLVAAIRPGSIVVLHEGTPARRGVIAATDELLTTCALTAVTVSELVRGAD
jgi:peptidoglycan/xylan/chitin deacetylase (PgdA/CDA1 family)